MLKTHSRLVGDAIVANPQSQGRNNPAKEAKEEKNLPTDKIIVSAWCQALCRRIINTSFGTSGFGPGLNSETKKFGKSNVFIERL